MAEVKDTAGDAIDAFTGSETDEDAFFALLDFSAKEVAVAAAMRVGDGGGESALEWENLTLANGAANLDGYGVAQYAIDTVKDLVYMRGAVNPGSDGVIGTLPAEARPSVKRITVGFADAGPSQAEILTTGEVDFFGNPGVFSL